MPAPSRRWATLARAAGGDASVGSAGIPGAAGWSRRRVHRNPRRLAQHAGASTKRSHAFTKRSHAFTKRSHAFTKRSGASAHRSVRWLPVAGVSVGYSSDFLVSHGVFMEGPGTSMRRPGTQPRRSSDRVPRSVA